MPANNYCMEFAKSILNGNVIQFDHENKVYWKRDSQKFFRFLDTGIPQFTVFTKGNSKLPFYSYSTLPAINCPGAGSCLKFCYSFKALRYSSAFFRMLQNTILERFAHDTLLQEFAKVKHGSTFRLFVDGDLNDHNIDFWIGAISARSDLNVYGYSKSLALIESRSEFWPKNWILNLSGGHNADRATELRFSDLPMVRGSFLAIDAESSKEAAMILRSKGIKKVFACPGKCGKCMANGKHACGNPAMSGVSIVIATH